MKIIQILSSLLIRCKSHTKHGLEIKNKNNSVAKKKVYNQYKQQIQSSLSSMKESCWASKAAELQAAADRKDTKAFYEDLNAVFGPNTAKKKIEN